MSMRNVGRTAVGSDRTAALPAGLETKLQRNVSGFPSASLDLLPSSCTVAPTMPLLSWPALATGGVLPCPWPQLSATRPLSYKSRTTATATIAWPVAEVGLTLYGSRPGNEAKSESAAGDGGVDGSRVMSVV